MSDDPRKLIAEADALRDRLEIELAAWGKLCDGIVTWVNEGRKLRAEVRKTNVMIRANLDLWADTRRLLLERLDDSADWWKNGGLEDQD